MTWHADHTHPLLPISSDVGKEMIPTLWVMGEGEGGKHLESEAESLQREVGYLPLLLRREGCLEKSVWLHEWYRRMTP